jgi:hypothetical protein
MYFAAPHESVPGPNRRFAAARHDAGNEAEADGRQTQPAPLHLTHGPPGALAKGPARKPRRKWLAGQGGGGVDALPLRARVDLERTKLGAAAISPAQSKKSFLRRLRA